MSFGNENRAPRPGGELPEWQLFQEKVHFINGEQKIVGFDAPDGKYYALEEGEELVHIKLNDNEQRETFIRKDGKDIPFEEWKEEK